MDDEMQTTRQVSHIAEHARNRIRKSVYQIQSYLHKNEEKKFAPISISMNILMAFCAVATVAVAIYFPLYALAGIPSLKVLHWIKGFWRKKSVHVDEKEAIAFTKGYAQAV